MGIEKLIVGVNKMDSCDWSEQRYNEIKEEMTKMIVQAGFKPKQVAFIPYSGFRGENLVDRTNKMPWYKGWKVNISKDEVAEGYTIYEALEKIARPPKRFPDKALRIPINGVYKIKGVGDVVTGRIEQGTLKAGDVVRVAPRDINNLKFFSIEMHHKTWPSAKPGDNIGMNIKGLDKAKMPKVGDVISLQGDVLTPVESFVAQIVVQEHPGQLKTGFSPCVHVRTGKSACKMNTIGWKMSKKTGNEKQENPMFLEQGDSAEVEFIPQQPIYLESFESCQGLGRIAVMDSNQLVMLGKVMSVKYKPAGKK
jgi:elongation factor 1-alpha